MVVFLKFINTEQDQTRFTLLFHGFVHISSFHEQDKNMEKISY